MIFRKRITKLSALIFSVRTSILDEGDHPDQATICSNDIMLKTVHKACKFEK